MPRAGVLAVMPLFDGPDVVANSQMEQAHWVLLGWVGWPALNGPPGT
jgi:hypothetical protein